MEKKEKLYFNSIDGLRFFASLSVVLYHYEKMGGFNNLNGSPGWLFIIIKGPAFHASLFFILAGFLFTIKYSKHSSEFSTATFLKSRLKQLYLLHFITTLAMVPFILQSESLWSGKFWISLFMHLSFLWPFFPFGTYTMNMPSWALAAFFFCYLLFKPTMNLINKINSKKQIVLLLSIPILINLIWGIIYAKYGLKNELYFFFHAFPPVRFFEFFSGMLIARIFTARKRSEPTGITTTGWYNDILILVSFALIYINLLSRAGRGDIYLWYSYHLTMPIIFIFLLYRFARGNGFIAKVMSLSLIRNLGKSSFYPYLLHIPLMAWFCQFLERGFLFKKFLHYPLNVSTFILLLYMISMLYVLYVRKRPVSEFKKT